ncbi:MAG: sigma-70 family RNA polymerase sigma factor [Lentisphaeraceae bacterium]|nr:sigma-70 family RNA polymerase sigma factor [Lentisphaeraceae bacterium]
MTTPRTRQTLLEKLRDRYDEASWVEFQETYGPYIMRILRALHMNSHDRDDLQQNIMLIAWKSLPKFTYQPEKGSFRAWISTVTRRECGHFIKKRQKTFISVSEEESQRLKDSLDTLASPDIERNINHEWEKFISEKAWENIKPRFTEKVLDVFQRLSSGEDTVTVAEATGISESSVYVYKKRVLNTLQKEILKLNQELN